MTNWKAKRYDVLVASTFAASAPKMAWSSSSAIDGEIFSRLIRRKNPMFS
jgi:hypothetical protein